MRTTTRYLCIATMSVLLSYFLPRDCLADGDLSKTAGLALLIGVADYKPGTFDNLQTPCKDIEFLAEILKSFPQIEVRKPDCNSTAAQIRAYVTKFHDDLADQPKGTFGLIYFAGHGLTLGDDVYLFGKQASVTVAEVVERLKKRSEPSGELIPPFKREAAIALLGELSPGNTAGNPVVIVVDACRSIPFAKEVVSATPGTGLLQIKPNIDTLIAFSAAYGSQALDSISGLTVSPYAKAFGDAIAHSDESSVTDLFSETRRNLRTILKGNFSTWRQQPAELNALESPVCLGGCKTKINNASVDWHFAPSIGSGVTKRAVSPTVGWPRLKNRSDYPLPKVVKVGYPFQPQMQSNSTSTVWDVDENMALANKLRDQKLGTMRLDIFWCDSYYHHNSYVKALKAGQALTAFAQSGGTVGESMLSKIRIRRLSPERNTEPGYQLMSDVIRYFPNSEAELSWTRFLREKLHMEVGEVLPVPVSTPTPGYISVFFCSPDDENATSSSLHSQPNAAVNANNGI